MKLDLARRELSDEYQCEGCGLMKLDVAHRELSDEY